MVGTHPYYVRTLGGDVSLSNLLSSPVLPSVDGMSFLKILAVGAGLIFVMGGLRGVFTGKAGK